MHLVSAAHHYVLNLWAASHSFWLCVRLFCALPPASQHAPCIFDCPLPDCHFFSVEEMIYSHLNVSVIFSYRDPCA
ncbi:hypothetical protein PIB30_007959 [Stylosanthes scabra]|uniref:Secreted protein n=1 Tax=Stylosanthes scabra TaxID=79078 RepID=A0ABU6T4N2_9FABA|nr:hypothetical protein [Stylosanthes scabra]